MRNVCIFIFNFDPPPFQSTYRKWAKCNNFLSKLPGDAKMQREAEEEVTRTLDCDLREKKPHEQVIPYSDKLFHQIAVEWLAATDQVRNSFSQLNIWFHPLPLSSQPIQALEHPKFKELIDVASRAKSGVSIPGRKATRAEIMRMFKKHLTTLKAQLSVCVPLGFQSFSHHFPGSSRSRRSQLNV